jgi:glycosyltransferase involved in cell wall biosynthesis
MYQEKSVGVVFPAYNEERHIETAVREFLSTKVVDKVYVIDNNSRDQTAELARRAGAAVIQETRQGYGYGLRRGLATATEDLIVLAEPDGTFVGLDILKLLSYSSEFDLVLGTRTSKELIWKGANMGWFLRIGNVLVAKMVELGFDGPLMTDCGCTFRLIRREAARKIQPFLTVGKSHFLPEMVILALLMELSIIEIPLNYKPRTGKSKITGTWRGAVSTGLKMIQLIVSYRFKTWFGWLPQQPPAS